MITGQLSKTESGFKGFVASMDFDVSVQAERNPRKEQEDQPDFIFTSTSPIGRTIRIGAGWQRMSQSENEYISISLQIGARPVRVNAVHDEEKPDTLRIIPWSE